MRYTNHILMFDTIPLYLQKKPAAEKNTSANQKVQHQNQKQQKQKHNTKTKNTATKPNTQQQIENAITKLKTNERKKHYSKFRNTTKTPHMLIHAITLNLHVSEFAVMCLVAL